MPSDRRLAEWLMDNGNAVTRWRTATELLPEHADMVSLQKELLAMATVQSWAERLPADDFVPTRLQLIEKSACDDLGHGLVRLAQRHMHACKDGSFETIFEKCIGLGLRSGLPCVDQAMTPFLSLLPGGQSSVESRGWFYDSWRISTGGSLMSYLARFGYWSDSAGSLVKDRLHEEHATARDRILDVYVEKKDLSTFLPPSWAKKMKNKRVMRPDLTQSGRCFPSWDILTTIAYAPNDALGNEEKQQLDTVIDYILDPAYQVLTGGHQTWDPDRKTCYATGFGVRLPGFSAAAIDSYSKEDWRMFIPSMVVLGKFAKVRKSKWFRDGMRQIEEHVTPDGTYRLPDAWLPAHSPGRKWLLRFGENRRKRIGAELESTFWVLKLRQIADS